MRLRPALGLLIAILVVGTSTSRAQTTPAQVKIGSLDLAIGGVSATITPAQPVIPKNIASGVQIVVTQNGQPMSAAAVARYLGGPFQIVGEYSGPGLPQTVEVPQTPPPANSLILALPAVTAGGNYALSNMRFVVAGRPAFDVTPSAVTVKVIDQVLVTSVQTTPLTLDQIQATGVVLDSSAYTGFQFTVGLQLSSQVVNISFPVVFNSQGIALPQPLSPPQATPQGVDVPQLPTIVPLLLEAKDGSKPQVQLPDGSMAPVRIPSVLVIPGNVGYLKQFFSAQLYVTNGAPGGSNLVVDNVTGTIKLPPGKDNVAGTSDDPLALPSLNSGPQNETMSILAPGPDGSPTLAAFNPGQTGQAQWTIRGDKEGFYPIDFDISATLEGLPTGAVSLGGTASGGVLVRNPYFNVTFTVPGVVRKGELFNVFATVTNTSQVAANNLNVTLNNGGVSGVVLTGGLIPPIPTLNPGDSTTLTFQFQSLRTGQVVANYLNFATNDGTTGSLNFALGVFANGTPMSPDTLVLPSSVDNLPSDIVDAAMRVLGQAWSVASAAPGTLPPGVTPTNRTVVTKKALALSEAGLRVSLGETLPNALRDLATDFWGGSPIDPGFDQVLRTTPAGQNFATLLGAHLAQPASQAGGAVPYELALAQLQASGPDFLTFAVANGNAAAPVNVTLVDAAGNLLSSSPPASAISGGVLLPLGSSSNSPFLGLVTAPTAPPYKLVLTGQASGSVDISISIPRGDGTVVRGLVTGASVVAGQMMRVIADFTNPYNLVLQRDTGGDGSFATSTPFATQTLSPAGPNLLSATVIGPETVSQAGSFGLNVVMLFDRVVDANTAGLASHYAIPKNTILTASRQLSGRLVFGNFAQPEGPYVPNTLSVSGIGDQRGTVGPPSSVTLQSLLKDPGAVVSGRVLDSDGTPSAKAIVTYVNTASSPDCQDSSLVGVATLPVIVGGAYQFRYVHQDQCGGPFQMSTTDPNTGSVRQGTGSVRAPGQQIVMDLAMLGLGSVAGTVLDLSGHPVSGAQVFAVSGTDPQVGGNAFTDGSGKYTINGITVGEVTVTAQKGISVGSSAGNIERARTTAVVNVTLNGGSVQVFGTVTQVANGVASPVPNVPVVYYSTSQPLNPIPVGVAITAANGTYSIKGMPVGPYDVLARLNSQLYADQSGVAVAGDNLPISLQIVVPSTATVSGKVILPDGSPAGGVVVYLDSNGVLSNTDGTFSLSGVPVRPSQSQTIYARTTDLTRQGQTTVVVNSATVPISGAIITLSGLGSAQFTVLDASGRPLSGQAVTLPDGFSGGCGSNSQKTNASGMVVFTGLPVGSVKAAALQSGGAGKDLAFGTATITQDGTTGYAIVQFHGVGTVTGRVVDPNKTNPQPVLGAVIQLVSNVVDTQACTLAPATSQSVQTDASGNFRFNSVNVGPVAVTASQSFYPTQVGGKGTLSSNGATVNFPLQLVNTISGVLSGTVFLPDGATPAGAGVQVTANGPLPDVTVSTDSSGNFKFAKIFPEGLYTVTASDPISGGTNQLKIYLRAGQDTAQNLRLKGTGSVNVTVVDGGGVPVGAAFVTLTETDYPGESFNGSLDASNQGMIAFPNVFEGAFSVQVADPLGRGGRASATLPQGTSSLSVQVRLTTTGTVQGHFYLPDGITPVPNAGVQLTANDHVIGQMTSLGTGDVGSYSFEYVPAGPVQLKALDPLTGRTGIAAGTITSQGQVLALDVRAQGLETVSGFVKSNGTPQPGATVTLVSGSFQATTTADATGMYLMSGVPEGVVVATASLGNGFLSGTASLPVSGDAQSYALDVNLRASGTITGQVLQADGVHPAAPSSVSISVGGVGGGTESTTTDSQGNFSFSHVPAGSGTIAAQVLGGIDQGTLQVDVPVAATATVQVKLNGVGAISGIALDSSGHPTPGNVVLAGAGSFRYSYNLTAAADGTFFLPQVLAGPFTAALSANIGGFGLYGTAAGSVAPNQTTNFTVQVQPSGTIKASVLRSDGLTPAVGANVSIQLSPALSLNLQVQNDGSFTAVGVPLGAFVVRINDPSTSGLAFIEGQSLTSNGQTANLGSIILDTNTLSAVASTPVDGATGVGINQPLTLTFSESLTSPAGIFVTNGSSTVPMAASLSTDGKMVTLTGQMPDGVPLALNITTQVTDVFGRQVLSAQVIHFTTADLTPPTVAAISPANQSLQVPVTVAIVATFNKALSTTASSANVITVTSGGGIPGTTSLTAPNVLTFTPSAPLLGDSIYTVRVNGAVSFGGNVQTTAYTSSFATPDTIPPSLQMIAPKNSAFVSSSRPAISIALSDLLSGIDPTTGTLTLDNQAVAPLVSGNTLTFTPATPLSDGSHALVAMVKDRAGNIGALPSSFSVDTTSPSAAQLSGVAEGQTVTGVLSLTGTANDSGSGVASIDVFVDGTLTVSLPSPSFQGSYNTAVLTAGTHTFKARAVDNVGNVGSFGSDVHVTIQQTGAVVGTVFNTQGQAIGGAQITLTATNGTFTTTAAANGTYQVTALALGSVSVVATDSTTGFRSAAYGNIVASGQVLTINVTVVATGSVNGTIFRSDGVTPAAGVQVSLSASFSTNPAVTTDAQGRYSFTLVPVGGFTVDVTDLATGDRARVSNQLNANGDVRTINLSLTGFGRVVVTVQNASGAPVANAQVTIQGQTQFGGSQSGATQANGTITFSNIFAGGFYVYGSDPQTGLQGAANGTVTPGGTANVTVQLQPSGNITGKVFAADGTTAIPNASVSLNGPASRQATSAADGSFQFTIVPVGTYTLSSADAAGNLRARVNVSLINNGDTAAQNVVWVALGTVNGHVKNPDATPAMGINVDLRSDNPVLGRFFNATTNSLGAYQIMSVPAGSFTASASVPAQGLRGETTGTITQEGQQVTADILLVNNAVTLPLYRYDGNNFFFDIQNDVSIGQGTNSAYYPGAFLLDIVSAGAPTRFTGNSIGSAEAGGRQIGVSQPNVGGLNVTRKVYVPRDGYFARYLEILSNPTPSPVSVDVRVTSNMDALNYPDSIISTSSGDNVLDIANAQNPDRWVVIDDSQDGDPASIYTSPATAFAFDGPGAAIRVSSATFSTPQYYTGLLTYQWSGVTIPANGTIAIMHFGVQQSSRASAIASAARLMQMPPEALASLSAPEMSEIVNFAVPLNGSSTLAPLSLVGRVNGTVFAGDGSTPVPGALVSLKSDSPFFGRTSSVYDAGDGSFQFQTSLGDFGNTTIIPVDSFTLRTTHPETGIPAPNTPGNFVAGQTAASQDIVFSGTGLVRGTVRRHTGVSVASGYVYANGTGQYSSAYGYIALDGTYLISGLPPGSYTLNASVPQSQGSSLSGTSSVIVIAGQVAAGDVTIVPTGAVQGTVTTASGMPAAGVYIYLQYVSPTPYLYRSIYTDGSGNFLLTDVPVGTYIVQATDPVTGVVNSAQVGVTRDQNTIQNFALVGHGTVQVQVNLASGSPAVGAYVEINQGGFGYFQFGGYTDSAGHLTIPNVAVGPFTIRAHNPQYSQIFADRNGIVANNGDLVSMSVTLPGISIIAGRVTSAHGAPVANAYITFTATNSNTYTFSDANGNYSFGGVATGTSFTLTAHSPADSAISRTVNQTAGADGSTTQVNFVMPAAATVQVTVITASSTPFAGAYIYLQDAFHPYMRFVGTTNPSGILNVPNVPEGAFTAQAQDPNTGRFAGSSTGTVAASDDGQTISVTINAPPSANLQGTVYGGDGQTPLPFISVQISDIGTGQFLGSASTDLNGFYQVSGITAGSQGLTVTAHYNGVNGSSTGTITTPGQTLTVNVTVPISVVHGTVTFSDGTPVPYPYVSIMQTDATGHTRTFFVSQRDAQGKFTVFNLAVGAFSLQAQDRNSGLNGSLTGAVASVSTPLALNVSLQPSGSLSGAIIDSNGAPVPFAQIQLNTAGVQFDQYATADAQGNYSFAQVPVGIVVVTAGPDPFNGAVTGASSGSITASGQHLIVNVTLQATSTVTGTVFAADGSTPVPFAYLAVENASLSGGIGDFYFDGFGNGTNGRLTADALGNFSIPNIPVGTVKLTAIPPDSSNPSGSVSGTLQVGSSLTLNPVFGNAYQFNAPNYRLTDANGFLVDVDCTGAIRNGGYSNGGVTVRSYYYAAYALLNSNYGFPFCNYNVESAAIEQGGQQLTFGPRPAPGSYSNGVVQTARKIFVPQNGGFARYLEILTNPFNTPVTAIVEMDSATPNYVDTLADNPANNGSTFAVLETTLDFTSPVLGYVFAGSGASTVPVTDFAAQQTFNSYIWTVTVPPNQSVILMHFLVQRANRDVIGAESQAQSLVNLTDPNALAGMNAQEKAEVVNFNVP